MEENALEYNSNGTLRLATSSVENKLGELFHDNCYTINLKTGEFGHIDMRYFFAYCLDDINPVAFDDEEIKKIPAAADSDTIYIIGFNAENPMQSVVEAVNATELAKLIENAYMSRIFLKHDIYGLLKTITSRLCEKYLPGHKIFSELLMNTNSVLLKDGTAVIAATECPDISMSFYRLIMKTDMTVQPAIMLSFGSGNYASVYTKPSNELFGLKADAQITGYLDPGALKGIVYELCLARPGMDEVLVFNMSSDGRCFNIDSVASYSDYRGLKEIMVNDYNNAESIITKIMEYNTESHTEDLLSLID